MRRFLVCVALGVLAGVGGERLHHTVQQRRAEHERRVSTVQRLASYLKTRGQERETLAKTLQGRHGLTVDPELLKGWDELWAERVLTLVSDPKVPITPQEWGKIEGQLRYLEKPHEGHNLAVGAQAPMVCFFYF